MTKAHQEIIDFMAAGSTSADVASFKPSAKARKRVADLIAQEKASGLLPEERRELDEYIQLEHLMRLASFSAVSESSISAALRRRIAVRASRRCEHCLIHEDDTFLGMPGGPRHQREAWRKD